MAKAGSRTAAGDAVRESGANTLAPLDAKLAEERVLGWQTKLHRWAAQDEQARFGVLFNLDPATLLVAWSG